LSNPRWRFVFCADPSMFVAVVYGPHAETSFGGLISVHRRMLGMFSKGNKKEKAVGGRPGGGGKRKTAVVKWNYPW